MPGQMMYTYHYILWYPGRVYHTKGKSDISEIFSKRCVFIDHVSCYMKIKYQVTINDIKLFKERLTLEREAQSQGVDTKGYQTDNGIFNDSEFMKEMLKKQQQISFSGNRASHENGAAERATKTVVTMERTVLTHAAIIFTEEKFLTDLWPMAMYYSIWIYNRIPDMQYGLSATEIWSRSRF